MTKSGFDIGELGRLLAGELLKRRVYKDVIRRQPRKHEREAADLIETQAAELRELRAENARLKEEVRRQTSLANDHFRNARRLAARAALGEPQ